MEDLTKKTEEEGNKRTFSQEELNSILKENKLQLRENNTKLQEEIGKQQTQISQLTETVQQLLSAVTESEEEDDDEFFDNNDDDLDANASAGSGAAKAGMTKKGIDNVSREEHQRIKAMLDRKYRKELMRLTERNESLEKERDVEKQKRIASQRHAVLRDAMLKAGVTEAYLDDAAKIVDTNLVYDEVDDTFTYRTKRGLEVAMEDGIAEDLPEIFFSDHMIASGPGSPGNSTAANERAAVEQELNRAMGTVAAKPDDSSLRKLMATRKKASQQKS